MPGRVSGSSLQGLQLLAARTAPAPEKALVGEGRGWEGDPGPPAGLSLGNIQNISRFTGEGMGLGERLKDPRDGCRN